jgi:hypothetical protein
VKVVVVEHAVEREMRKKLIAEKLGGDLLPTLDPNILLLKP